jgi:alkylation response protein AidB-like acyl-CoA dehydrogenase
MADLTNVYLSLSEEQELLRHAAQEFVRGKSSLARVRALRDSRDPLGFSPALWREMAALGWVGIILPESVGGAGLGYMDLAVVMEALGWGLLPEPMLSTVLLGANAVLLGGSEAQRQEHLPRIAAGKRLFAVAYQERGARHDAQHVETRAERADGGWSLTGTKVHVVDGHAAGWLVVSARTAGGIAEAAGVTLFVLRSDAPGVAVERHCRVDGRKASMVRLEGARVDPEAVLGEVDGGGALLARVLDRACAGLAAEMLGGMAAAFEMTMDYIKTRKQFGVPVGSFQALKHRAAVMYVEMELTRSAVMAAARALDDGQDETAVARAVSLAKARASDVFMLVANEGIQMHGGIGMTDEHDIGFFLKRARVAEMTFGDAVFHRDRVARIDGY